MTKTLRNFALSLTMLVAACTCATQEAINTAEIAAAGNDRYHTLVQDGLDTLPPGDLERTPERVRELLQRTLNSLYVNRVAWHSVLFMLDAGDDPAKLDLAPIKLPEPAAVAPVGTFSLTDPGSIAPVDSND